jgi:signal transduction histidine kinase
LGNAANGGMVPFRRMSDSDFQNCPVSASLSREEFDEFLHVFTHEIRNRLNAVGLEATDLAEQLEGMADFTRLQARVRDCSAFLKTVRDLLAPGEAGAEKLAVAGLTAKLRTGGSLENG